MGVAEIVFDFRTCCDTIVCGIVSKFAFGTFLNAFPSRFISKVPIRTSYLTLVRKLIRESPNRAFLNTKPICFPGKEFRHIRAFQHTHPRRVISIVRTITRLGAFFIVLVPKRCCRDITKLHTFFLITVSKEIIRTVCCSHASLGLWISEENCSWACGVTYAIVAVSVVVTLWNASFHVRVREKAGWAGILSYTDIFSVGVFGLVLVTSAGLLAELS